MDWYKSKNAPEVLAGYVELVTLEFYFSPVASPFRIPLQAYNIFHINEAELTRRSSAIRCIKRYIPHMQPSAIFSPWTLSIALLVKMTIHVFPNCTSNAMAVRLNQKFRLWYLREKQEEKTI